MTLPLSLSDFEDIARRKLPRGVFEYVSGGVEDNLSLRLNAAAFDRWAFRPRTLTDISKRDMSTEVFGQKFSAPFGVAPMGGIALAWAQGDAALARAAEAEKVAFLLSGASCVPMEKLREVAPSSWFQAYLPPHEKGALALVERAAKAGYEVLVVTVDVPVMANRENIRRLGFSLPVTPSPTMAWDGLCHPGWLFNVFLRTFATSGMPYMENQGTTRGVPLFGFVLRKYRKAGPPRAMTVTWPIMEAVRHLWKGKLVIKGLLTAEDARRAAALGADGIIVSNHGGRQLDGAIAPLDALPEIIAAVPDVVVMLDSGVRRGSHVLKALALGARFVFVGRPMWYAVASGGTPSAQRAMKLLADEIDRDMGLLGIASLKELDASFVTRA